MSYGKSILAAVMVRYAFHAEARVAVFSIVDGEQRCTVFDFRQKDVAA